MSSFISSEKHIKSIEVALLEATKSPSGIFPRKYRLIEGYRGIFDADKDAQLASEQIKSSIKRLYEMQINSVNADYADFAKPVDTSLCIKELEHCTDYKDLSSVGLLKAIESVLYQINTVSDEAIYYLFKGIIGELALSMVRRTADYNSAEWDIE